MNTEIYRIRITASLVIFALLATASSSSAKAQQPSEAQVARILKRFPQVDKDKDGKLSTEELEAVRQMLQSRQRNRRPGAAAKPTQTSVSGVAHDLFSAKEILDESTLD